MSVRQAVLATRRRNGASENSILVAQSNLAGTYRMLGRLDDCLRTQRDVYSGRLKLHGEEDAQTLRAAGNYAISLNALGRLEEVKSLLRKTMPAARRVFGESNEIMLKMRWNYAIALYQDPGASLDNLREAVTTLEEIERTARRVMGGAHPITTGIEVSLRNARRAAVRKQP